MVEVVSFLLNLDYLVFEVVSFLLNLDYLVFESIALTVCLLQFRFL